MNLVVVESPTKAKTLSAFLGKNYKVVASMGHVRDLPKSKLGVDTEGNFKPDYTVSPKAKKVISQLKNDFEQADKVYLATDPDREGEAIAWHVWEVMNEKEATKKKSRSTKVKVAQDIKAGESNAKYERVVFHEITKSAVEEAFAHPRKLDTHLIDAQQARRVLDRIVGYKLSPLLWKKVRYGLSAGRVQSVAVRLIVEREQERNKFKPDEYWTISSKLENSSKEVFLAHLVEIKGKKPKILNETESNAIVKAVGSDFKVEKIDISEKKRNTYPPFTTSTLQQAASNRLGFASRRTMSAAQKLFEEGLITYHRTDSMSLSGYFLDLARDFIKHRYGSEFLPEKPNFFKNRSKNAQEAHEAIRPTNPALSASELTKARGDVTSDERKIYDLILKRALASQMLPAIYDQVSASINAGQDYLFRAVGSRVKFEGWLKVYGVSGASMDKKDKKKEEDKPEEDLTEDEKKADLDKHEDGDWLPKLDVGEKLNLLEMLPKQHFTEPAPRFTEASLIKAMEEQGIGRPSTYAPTISTIQDRGYVTKIAKYFVPQDVGIVVTRLLTDHFENVVDYQFTAQMESDLDEIAEGKKDWVEVLKAFYTPFIKEIDEKEGSLVKSDYTVLSETDEKCPECGKPLIIKLGKYGRFKSCSGFPECKFAQPIVAPTVVSGQNGTSDDSGSRGGLGEIDTSQLGKCPECKDGDLQLKEGRFGKFIACNKYPACKFTKPYMDKIGVLCPTCGKGDVIMRKGGRFRKVFYGCSRYPECKFTSSKDPREKEIEKSEE